jgi:PilZ domain-containing protein
MDRTEDTRKHKRFAVDVEAVVHTPGGPFPARTRDLSKAGICLITSVALKGNQWVGLELVLAFGDNAFSEPLRLDARVVWCTPIGTSFQVGAMFNALSHEDADFLNMFLRYLDGSLVPGRQAAAEEEEEREAPPDEKDDPFRR